MKKIRILFSLFVLEAAIFVFSLLFWHCAYAQDDTFDLKDDEMQNETLRPPAELGDTTAAQANEIVSASSNEAKGEVNPDVKDNNLITVNFENVDVRDVIRLLADKAQLNMVVGPDVQASINLQLTNVSWDKALDIILKTYNLTSKREGDLIRIMTLEQMRSEDEKSPLATKILMLNFARAGEVKGNFQNMLSSRGKIDVNDRTNSLIVTDIPDNIVKIEEVIPKLDTRTPQVMIEALMVDIKLTQNDQLGVNWLMELEPSQPGTGAVIKRSISQTTLGTLNNTPGVGLIKFGTTILTDKDLHASIGFLQSQQRLNILAHPQIMTLDNLPAKVNLTEEVPYQQQTQSTQSSSALTTTAFKEAGISLSVTPHITTKDNFIYLNLDVKQSIITGPFGTDNQPGVDSRSATTNLLVKNHETAVIGGLRKKNDKLTTNKLPILGDIPLLGAVFRSRQGSIEDTDLMIFVTPTIVQDIVLSPKESERAASSFVETPDWDKNFKTVYKMGKRPKPIENDASSKQGDKYTQSESYFYLRPPLLNEGAK